ncbi:FliI/YscN family ATPase [Trinickia dinghuensis]|uniref:FliI/YscN family ATPase n=1 Tax=Trinickia dinghuensis TaxID=2291023 RepID=A0A3D8JV27_9BURK|nr:FliI/YscN family ATPase [Trinickia dinghuensis]RDU96948.1 FliI/YscN family ATPase [Trinickia dinghuensis]
MNEAGTANLSVGTDVKARLAAWTRRAHDRLDPARAVFCYGRVEQISATLVVASLPRCAIGDLCELSKLDSAGAPVLAEVIGFDAKHALLAPLGPLDGIGSNSPIRTLGVPHSVRVGPHLFGKVLDGFGRSMRPDAAAAASASNDSTTVRVLAAAPCAAARPLIDRRVVTGVRAIDALLTLARGQRAGLFAGPGCGKSTLLGALARGIDADAIVVGLVGERGRELNEFLERELDPPLTRRTVVVCATSDAPPMERARAAFTATAIAEGFCHSGRHVLLLIDSLTRFARAQREIGLASNEPPGRLGYPPSVYAALPRLIERAGNREHGAITGIYTVLTETEHADPIADEARSLLDAHIVLSRKLAERGHFPAVDVIASLSRLMPVVADLSHRHDAEHARMLLSRYGDLEWLISLGEYEPGHDPAADDAVARYPRLAELLRQDLRIPVPWEKTLEQLHAAVRGQ